MKRLAIRTSLAYDRAVSRKHMSILLQIGAALLFVVGPLPARADSSTNTTATEIRAGAMQPAQPAYAPIVISEIQAGSATSASEEFIELYNQSPQTIDLATGHWQVQIASSKATAWTSPLRTISLAGSLVSGGYYLLASNYQAPGESGTYLSATADGTFSAGLSAESGHVRVVYTATATGASTQIADDELEWTTTNNGQMASASIDGRAPFELSTALIGGSSLKRVIRSNGTFADTDMDSADFILSLCPSPTGSNAASTSGQDQPATSGPGQATGGSDAVTVPIATDIDIINQACATPPSTQPPPAGDGAAGSLSPPQEEPPVAEETGESQGDNAMPTTQPRIPADDAGLVAPQITELLPNPAPPQTDTVDEFIELYNGNAQSFDLSGFSLETGARTKHHYVFPSGATLPGHGFVAYFADTTGIALTNAGGQVSLLDPFGTTIDKTDSYGAAKDGQAWVLAYGAWQWTATPTPNAPNAVTAPSPTKSKKSAPAAKVAAAKVTASTKKAAKGSKGSVPAVQSNASASGVAATDTPLHPGVLAAATLFAVLYGAYEYRADVANRIDQFRRYRAYRRERRPSFAWWRGD